MRPNEFYFEIDFPLRFLAFYWRISSIWFRDEHSENKIEKKKNHWINFQGKSLFHEEENGITCSDNWITTKCGSIWFTWLCENSRLKKNWKCFPKTTRKICRVNLLRWTNKQRQFSSSMFEFRVAFASASANSEERQRFVLLKENQKKIFLAANLRTNSSKNNKSQRSLNFIHKTDVRMIFLSDRFHIYLFRMFSAAENVLFFPENYVNLIFDVFFHFSISEVFLYLLLWFG